MAEWLERNRANLAAALVVLVTVAGITLVQMPRRAALQVVSPAIPVAPLAIKVHVVGAVLSPGVYPLPADARLEDALKAAGGPSEAADLATLNLAMPLKDGQQVVIPPAGAQPPASFSAAPAPPSSSSPSSSAISAPSAAAPSSSSRSGKLDLNSASRKELEALPGIGVAIAQRLLDYRQAHGRITSLEELRDAKILNASTYEKVKDLVEVR